MCFQGHCVFASFGLAIALCLCTGSGSSCLYMCFVSEKFGFWWLIIQVKSCFFYAEGARNENGWCCHNEHGR